MSPDQSWATSSHVNAQQFNPGDTVLFERGGLYRGTLRPQGSGTSAAPISVGCYGTGNLPVIDAAGSDAALKLFNQQYWNIDSLEVTGGQKYGVFVGGDASYRVLHAIHLTNLKVHDMYGTPAWDSGLVMVAATGDHTTFDDVVVDRVLAYNTNFWYGIHVGFNLWYGYPTNPPRTTNIKIRNSTVHHVYGDGITVAQAQNTLIERNVVYETGLAPSGVSYTPNGIWSWQSDNTTIQYNEGYSTHSYAWDGGVFDIDWGSTNTIIQYNYAHDAEGYCVAVMGAHNVTTSNSIVRFNICSNNARKQSQAPQQGDIFITTFDGGSIDGVQIYNNTGYWNPGVDAPWIRGRGVYMTGNQPRFIMNNIVYSSTSTMLDLDNTFAMDRDLYWLAGPGVPTWKFGSSITNRFSDFQSQTGQDGHGIYADPAMNEPTYDAVGKPVSAFTLRSGSPAIGAGAGWSGMATTDFFGNSLPASGSSTIGAYYGSGSPLWVNIISKNSGLCLDAISIPETAWATQPGTHLQQWACWGGSMQKWMLMPVAGGYEITSMNSGLQVDVAGGPSATQDGADIIQWPYWGGSNEIWQLVPTADGYYQFVPNSSGKCMDVAGASKDYGASVIQWTCHGGDNQKWQIVAAQ